MNQTTIEWATHTWNPVTGCSPVSEGCVNCYAKRMAQRLRGRFGYPEDEPFRVTLHRDRLLQPLKLRKPSRIFVCSMGDLFHEDVPDKWIDQIFAIMALAPQHTYILLTKRPERMQEYFGNKADWVKRATRAMRTAQRINYQLYEQRMANEFNWDPAEWEHLWLGVTAENQQRADERIPILLQTPAAVRLVSCEPLLGETDLTSLDLGDRVTRGYGPRRIIWNALTGWERQYPPGRKPKPMPEQFPKCMSNDIGGKLDWIISGGETGPGARPLHPDWVRSLREQCQDSGVPFLFKQWGEYREACAPDDPIWNRQTPKLRHEHGTHFIKLGAKKAGRILDGEIWDEYPEVSSHV